MLDLNIQNEYNSLKSVFISNRQNPDMQGFIRALKDLGIKVFLGGKTPTTQIYWPFLRDPFITVDKLFMIGGIDDDGPITTRPFDLLHIGMDIMDHLEEDQVNGDVLTNQENGIPIVLEGGDVIIHNGTIYVGQGGQFTNKYGFGMMEALFSNKFDVKPIFMEPREHITHLDCVFNPISADTAIVHLDSIMPISRGTLKRDFAKLIELTKPEQKALACNVLSIGNKQLFVEQKQERLINTLKKLSFKPIPTKFDMPIQIGGSFRCATVPLERE